MSALAPKVAVLLSTYNGARFLEEQIASLREQRGVEVMLHARDDGSTDGTLQILARHAERWPSLAKLTSGPNLGPAASFLELLRTAPDDADYYAFCDQDDVWLPEKLERAVSFIASDEGPALYCSNVVCVDEDLKVLGVPREKGDACLQHLLFENIAYGCTIVMNRAARAIINSRPVERGLSMHDWWCALVVSAFGVVRFDSTSWIMYRQHGQNSIGESPDLWNQIVGQLGVLSRKRRSYYSIHAQAAELAHLYGNTLPASAQSAVVRLVNSKKSFVSRARYAFSREVERSHIFGSIAARSLILVGWY